MFKGCEVRTYGRQSDKAREIKMDEKIFLNENGTRVTNARFITPAQTYAMSGVTSVKKDVKPGSRVIAVVLALIGVFVLLASSGRAGSVVFGLISLCGGVYLACVTKEIYFVVIHSASGESRAMQSKDKGFIDRVIEALNDSIIERG